MYTGKVINNINANNQFHFKETVYTSNRRLFATKLLTAVAGETVFAIPELPSNNAAKNNGDNPICSGTILVAKIVNITAGCKPNIPVKIIMLDNAIAIRKTEWPNMAFKISMLFWLNEDCTNA